MKGNTIFANWLKTLRHQHGVTQVELAKQAGIHEDSILLWENNRHRITNQKLNKLAEFFNVSPDYLKGLTDDPRPLQPLPLDAFGIYSLLDAAFLYEYAKLSDEGKEMVREYIHELWESEVESSLQDEVMEG